MREDAFSFRFYRNGLEPQKSKVVQYLFLPVKVAESGHSIDATETPMYSTSVTGYLLRSEPQTLRQALISIDVILQVPFTKREAKNEKTSRLNIQHRYVVAVVFQSLIDVKMQVQFHFTIASI